MDRWTAHPARMAILALILASCSATLGEDTTAMPPSGDGGGGGSGNVDQDAALITRLQTTMVDADYDRTDFDELIDDLRRRHDLNIHVSWKSLEREGIRRDQRMDIHLTRVPLSTLLDLALREAGKAYSELSYSIEGGVIIVSSREDLARNTILRAYDITDLIESGYAIRRFGNTPVLSMEVTGREFFGGEKLKTGGGGGSGGGGGGGGSIYGDPGADPTRLTKMERIESIIDLIQENIEPDSWRALGGDVGSIHLTDNVLLIRHTVPGHAKVRAFLELIREARPRPLDADVVIMRLRSDRAAEWREKMGADFPRLDEAYIDELMTTTDDDDLLFRAASSGFNGQRFWFSALTQRDVLTGFRPTVGEAVNAFSPATGFSKEGLELIALPLVTPGGDELTLDVQMAWIPPAIVAERSVRLAPGEAEASIDQVTCSMRTVSTMTRGRLGEGIALSIPDELDDPGRPTRWEDWLILRIREPALGD
ncbi:MAG: hypothetical protein SYC29_17715 [Planctomycetota bacterium]|nr:hypothetical protein [Planctomycetota bacterium]